MGPLSSNLIASEISAITGDSETRALAATAISKSRLQPSAIYCIKLVVSEL